MNINRQRPTKGEDLATWLNDVVADAIKDATDAGLDPAEAVLAVTRVTENMLAPEPGLHTHGELESARYFSGVVLTALSIGATEQDEVSPDEVKRVVSIVVAEAQAQAFRVGMSFQARLTERFDKLFEAKP